MLLIRNEELVLTGSTTSGTEVEKVIKTKIKELRKTFAGQFPLRFEFDKKLQRMGSLVDSDFRNEVKVPVYPSLKPIPLSAQVVIAGERVVLTYCTSRREKNGKWINLPKNLAFRGKLSIDEHDEDLAFFLLYCLPAVNNAFDCVEIKRVKPNNAFTYSFIDENRVATAIVQKDKAVTEVKYLINNTMTDEQVKGMSIVYNIAGAEMEAHADKLRVSLFTAIELKAKSALSYENVYGEFIAKYKALYEAKSKAVVNDIKKDEPIVEKVKEVVKEAEKEENEIDKEQIELDYKTLISQALAANIIMEFGKGSSDFSKKRWCFKVDGKQSDKICGIFDNDPNESLYKEMLNNEDLVKAIKTKLSEVSK